MGGEWRFEVHGRLVGNRKEGANHTSLRGGEPCTMNDQTRADEEIRSANRRSICRIERVGL